MQPENVTMHEYFPEILGFKILYRSHLNPTKLPIYKPIKTLMENLSSHRSS